MSATDFIYQLDLSDEEYEWLETLLDGKYLSAPRRAKLRSVVESAHAMPAPPSDADWERIEAEARRQGCTVADIVWDLSRPAVG